MLLYLGSGDSDKEKRNDKSIKPWSLCAGKKKKCYRERITILKWTKMKGGKMIQVKINDEDFRGSLKIQLTEQFSLSKETGCSSILMTDYA